MDILHVTAAFDNLELGEEESMWNSLPNELLINILRYLPHSDLQQIRLVCKRWHHITQLPEFMEKSKLIINPDNVVSLCSCLIDDLELFKKLAYNTLELHDLDVSDDLKLILMSLGPNIRVLRLHKSPVFDILNEYLPELEELIIHKIDLEENFMLFSMDFSKLKNLKSFDISCNVGTTYLISQLVCGMNPKVVKLSVELSSVLDEGFVIYTLEQYANALKYLEIECVSSPTMLTEWKEVFASFRQLESLKIYGSLNAEWMQSVIECLPKETPLRICGLSGSLEINDSLLQLIVRKWSRSLENVELLFCNAVTDVGAKDVGKLRHNLKSLNISHCTKVSHSGLLEGLAAEKNNILNILILNSIPDMDPLSMGLLAQRLPQLTYLSLANCRGSVNDSTLEHIFRHQRKLQHLILDDCILITDEGILGFGLNPASISNLKGLQTLSLIGCSNLSNFALIKGLKFNQLRKLVLGYCKSITSMGIETLVVNCPALDDLTISSCLMIDDDAMMYIAQGLRRLRRLNVSNCNKLTGKALSYVVESCKCLKELSMCGIDLFAIQEVQEKFLQLKPKILKLNFS